MTPDDFNVDEIFLVIVGSVDDEGDEYAVFVRGTNELALFLLHYNKDLYVFKSAESFCPSNKIFWDYKELLNKKGDSDDR